jgi:Matrixin/Putative peptidoglycan binding domain
VLSGPFPGHGGVIMKRHGLEAKHGTDFPSAAGGDHSDGRDVLAFLARYGYLAAEQHALETTEAPAGLRLTKDLAREVRKALLEYQAFFGLKRTGRADAATLASMSKPRCRLAEGFTLGVLASRSVTCFFAGSPPPGITTAQALANFQSAMNEWQGVPLVGGAFQFVPAVPPSGAATPNGADLVLSWSGQVDPGTPDAIAFAVDPGNGTPRTITFLESTNIAWTVNRGVGRFDVRSVCLHELGHILGLTHNGDVDSVMFPQFSGVAPNNLPPVDVTDLIALYH